MLRAIIVDDEIDAINLIKSILEEYCPQVEVLTTADSAVKAKVEIERLNPDLVFLDVEMPNANGFELLESIEKPKFDVIFITAYNHYAIKAIKYSAADYILKPIDIDELVNAVKSVDEVRKERLSSPDFQTLLENIRTPIPKKLAIPTGKGIEYINTNQIIRIEADRSYSIVYIKDASKIVVSRSLVEYHELLHDNNFFRPHNSHLINLEHVKLYSRNDGGYIEMIDGSIVSLARSKKELFLERMKRFSISLNSGGK